MKKCILIEISDYNSILSSLHNAKIDAESLPNSYSKNEIMRHIDDAVNLLKEEEK